MICLRFFHDMNPPMQWTKNMVKDFFPLDQNLVTRLFYKKKSWNFQQTSNYVIRRCCLRIYKIKTFKLKQSKVQSRRNCGGLFEASRTVTKQLPFSFLNRGPCCSALMLHLAVESSKVGNLQRFEEVFHYCLSTTWIKVSPKPFAYTYEGTQYVEVNSKYVLLLVDKKQE